MGKTTHIDTEVEVNTLATQPIALLQKTMEEHSISFAQVKERAVQKKMENAESWKSIEDISPLSMFTIISGIKNKNKN